MRSILTALQEGRLFELPQAGKDQALEFLARILDANPEVEVGTDAIEEIQRREHACNTGIGLGVGVPHVRARREDGELFCAIGWSPAGIDYGATDGMPVHLVLMYYIPGAQKNVYLKEISSLVKAIKNRGGIGPIAQAPGLNELCNRLLDWVGEALGETGPDAVARMIKLEVRQAQAPAAAPAGPLTAAVPAGRLGARAVAFTVLVAGPGTVFVLATDPDWVGALEKDAALAQRLGAGAPFTAAGRQVFVTGVTAYTGSRTLYACVALQLPAPADGA